MEVKGTDTWCAAIRNDGWMVRYYVRGGRTSIGRMQREQAIQKLGLTVRAAFASSDDFEALLAAIVDGLRPRDDQPF
jgi:hypothetical protein